MINTKKKKCEYNGCLIQPYYGFIYKKPIYCKTHSETGMINVVSKKCNHNSCEKTPRYGLTGGKPTVYGQHKTLEMVELTKKKCEKCNTRASFGLIEARTFSWKKLLVKKSLHGRPSATRGAAKA